MIVVLIEDVDTVVIIVHVIAIIVDNTVVVLGDLAIDSNSWNHIVVLMIDVVIVVVVIVEVVIKNSISSP